MCETIKLVVRVNSQRFGEVYWVEDCSRWRVTRLATVMLVQTSPSVSKNGKGLLQSG